MRKEFLMKEIIRIQKENKQGCFTRVCTVEELKKLSAKELTNVYRIAIQFDH